MTRLPGNSLKKEFEDLEKRLPSPRRSKFRMKATEDKPSGCDRTKERELDTLMISTISILLGCSTTSLTLLEIFKTKELEKYLKEVEKSPPA